MFFLKPKQTTGDELLPPPPPDMDFKDKEKPKFFDEVVKPKEAETFPEEDEFSNLVKGLDEEQKPKAVKTLKKKKAPLLKSKVSKKEKIMVKKQSKEKQKVFKKIKLKAKKIKAAKATKKRVPKADEYSGLEEFKFDTPQELELSKKELGLPEEFGMLETKKKPQELVEAEDEIEYAIDVIKKQEKPSLFKRLFAKKEVKEVSAELMPSAKGDNLAIIQTNIKKAREALAKFDLETARRNYIEIMNIYSNIMPEEQAKVYKDIRELYFERKSAEELKV